MLFNLKIKLLICFILVIIFPIKNSLSQEAQYTEKVEYIMGTFFKIGIYDKDKNKSEILIKKAFKEIRRLENIISNYKNDSEISLIVKKNKYPVKISDELKEIIKLSLFFSYKSNGLFDITIEELVKLWGFKDKKFYFPKEYEINNILKKIGYKNIILKDNYLVIKNNNTLDFGAIGKGWAIDKAVNILKNGGIKSGFIDSRSTSFFIGLPPNKDYWEVKIDNSNKIIKIKANYSVSTSSNTEQYFEYKNKKYSHIINPKTGYPIDKNKLLSCTVISKNASYSDALSTILTLMNKKDIDKFMKNFIDSDFFILEDNWYKKILISIVIFNKNVIWNIIH